LKLSIHLQEDGLLYKKVIHVDWVFSYVACVVYHFGTSIKCIQQECEKDMQIVVAFYKLQEAKLIKAH
jgi:hypothetical protein